MLLQAFGKLPRRLEKGILNLFSTSQAMDLIYGAHGLLGLLETSLHRESNKYLDSWVHGSKYRSRLLGGKVLSCDTTSNVEPPVHVPASCSFLLICICSPKDE